MAKAPAMAANRTSSLGRLPADGGSLWHPGEMALQEIVGVRRAMERQGAQVIRDHLIDQHRLFFPLLPSVVVGVVDGRGDVWATIREGYPGFLAVQDDRTFEIKASADPSDPAEAGLSDGGAVGLLGIQLGTRRRNRLNGYIRERKADGFSVTVQESYGNCPQYIQLRNFAFSRVPGIPRLASHEETETLDEIHRDIIASADTFFVASYVDRSHRRQVDVSHRGGKPGFVRVDPDGSLTIPDFSGNLYFNTLGNILVNGRAGLCFPDFETGAMLQITGKAEVILDSPEIDLFQGAERLSRVVPERVVLRRDALALRWTKIQGGESPNSMMTGSWADVASQRQVAMRASQWRPFRIAHRAEESTNVSSFYLESADGESLIRHEAGQYLPIRVRTSDAISPVIRNYTISAAPSDKCYRLSIKRNGAISSLLHDRLDVGAIIEARGPSGAFVLREDSKRPSVLIAAGIGVTPMIAMLRHRLFERYRTRSTKATWLFYAARSLEERAFDQELETLAAESGDWLRVVRVLGSSVGATEGRDYELRGRLTAELVKRCLPSVNCDFYLCGPSGFMQDMYDGLRVLDVPDERISAEAFGPAGIRRSHRGATVVSLHKVSSRPVKVRFEKSQVEAIWEPGTGTLLELAERIGLAPEYSCRSGSCGACRVPLTTGQVTYGVQPDFEVSAAECLLCCAIPAERASGDNGPVSIEV